MEMGSDMGMWRESEIESERKRERMGRWSRRCRWRRR